MLDPETLRGFSIAYLQEGFDNPVPSPKFHEEMWKYCLSDHKLVAIAAPRGSAKSTAVTGTYVLGSVVFREHDFVIIISDTEGQAKLFLGDLKKQVTENDKLMAAFNIDPVKPLITDSKTDIIINFMDGHKARIMAKGSGQKGRGLKWEGKRPNLIVCDDMENEELVANPQRRKDFRRWLRNSVIQSLSKNGKIRIVGTILHSDSALENYMPDTQTPKKDKEECVKCYPNKTISTYKGPEMVWHGARYKSHPGINDYSKLLWPEAYNEEWYINKYHQFLADGDSEGYAQEYLNQPIDESQAFFKSTDLVQMEEYDWGIEKTWYCGVDLAISTQQSADWSVFAVVGLDEHGIMHVTDIIRQRIDTYDIVDKFFDIYRSHRGVKFIVEKGSIWEAVKPVLFKEMQKRQIYFDWMEVGSIKDKRTRARPLQHRTRARSVKFDKDSLWWPECEIELRQFDRGKHDDQVDALGIIPLVLQKLAEGEEYKEEEREEEIDFEEHLAMSKDDWESGRSLTCGY